jgi:hypothetical protein
MYIRHHPENEFGGRRIKAAAKVVAVVKVIAVAGFPVLDIFFNIIGGRCFVFDCGRIPKDGQSDTNRFISIGLYPNLVDRFLPINLFTIYPALIGASAFPGVPNTSHQIDRANNQPDQRMISAITFVT